MDDNDKPIGPLTVPRTTVASTSSNRLHPLNIPANIILPSMTSYNSLFDLQDTPNTDASSFHSTFFFQNWMTPASSTSYNTIGQTQQQQQSTLFSPQSFYYGSLGTSSFISPSYASSYFDHNQVDVIMDDGTRQKRTISLSTVPRFPSFSSILSPRGPDETTRLLASPYDDVMAYQKTTRTQQSTKHKLVDQQDYFSDSDDDDDMQHSNKKKKSKRINILPRLKLPALTTGQKLVLKCSFAYILGASFTFVPFLHQWINGGEDGVVKNRVASDMAATVAVFFNPAKTVGGMIEAAGLGWIMTLGALSICLASLWTTDYFLDYLHQTQVSYCITLFGWLLTSTLFLAFLKARYSNRPSVGTASSLAFIILFPILIREHTLDESQYSRQKIQDTVAIVAIGSAISAAVCFFIWPQTATKKFNSNMNDSLQSLRILLKLLTKTFLLDADLPDFQANEPLAQAIQAHKASFTALESSLQEARLEWWWWSKFNGDDGHDRMVKSIQQLALHIGGLRKSCGLQFDRTQQTSSTSTSTSTKDNKYNVEYQIRVGDQRRKFEETLKREYSIQDVSAATISDDTATHDVNGDKNDNSNKTGDGGLISFMRTVGPPMKSLAYTCKQTIIHLQWHFLPTSSTRPTSHPPSFATLRRNLGLALDVFEQSQQKALNRLYRQYTKNNNNNNNNNNAKTTTNNRSHLDVHDPFLSHLPADDVFLVYYFVFCLIAFAKELEVLVSCMEQIFDQDDSRTSLTSLVLGIKCFFTAGFRSNNDSSFQPNNPHTLDTLHTPTPSNFVHSFRLGLWSFFSWFRKYQVRYAIKAGLTALVLASMAFIPSTQLYFQTYRMEWTLITALAVMTPTVGGTNFIAVLQLGATVFGVVIGSLVYRFFSDYHVIVFIVLTWLLSLPCFWMVLHEPKYGKFGQFTLLAYTLVILYKYNHPDVDVYELAYQRCVSVCLGVIIGLVVTTYMWPYEARKEVRYGLSDLLLKFSWQYYLLNGNNNNNNKAMNNTMMMSVAMEDETTLLDLQQHLYNLSTLLNHTPNEPRLKGRFPVKTYQVMLQSCQSILDNLVMMRMVTNHQMKDKNQHIHETWVDMVGNVVLYFYVLASALQLKTPLPPYLPPADMARKQLMARLQSSATATTTTTDTTIAHLHDASYMAYYAYVILMETMLYDMDQLGCHMKALYGSLIPHWQV
ncbi:Fusaric acid resistance protein-like-domain-containing protein [Chlamydoabsidia padenii]|nr:Fusaric acid resistance protein-like-domain-containing protein [Chlamydoabsidia padenii]